MLELLVVQWYSQWETLSRRKGENITDDRKTSLSPPKHKTFRKLSPSVILYMKITSDNISKNKFINGKHR